MLNRRTAALFVDLFLTLALVFMVLMNPPPKETDAPPAGDIAIEVTWPDGQDCDVDVWVRAPGDKTVGYSSKSGIVFNLLRDDLGRINDLGASNYEFVFSRGIPAGEYVVNLHMFRVGGGCSLPAPVRVRASIIRNGQVIRIFDKTAHLAHIGQELTVKRFTIKEDGSLDREAYNELPMPLRQAAPPVQ